MSILDTEDIKEFTNILDEIDAITHDKKIDFNSAKHILDNTKINHFLQLIRSFYVYISAKLEKENALPIINRDNPMEVLNSFHFYERYIGLIENKRQLAKFNENKTFCFLGSGPLPLTLRIFNLVTGCKCVGVEQVAELSRKVLKRLELDNDIKIVTGNEKTLVEIDFDILMITRFTVPKKQVFSTVRDIVDEKTPVLYRTYSGMRTILYAPVTDEDVEGFHKKKLCYFLKKRQINTSVLIKKY